MVVMVLRFLYNEPAIFYKKALIIGDVHFGIEKRLMEKGIYENTLSERLKQKIENLIYNTKAKKLIIAGDVKDEITILDEITMKLINSLCDNVEVIIVKGNHDGGIEKTKAIVVDASGFLYGQVGVIHGHSWPNEEVMSAKWIVSAHQHPQIRFTDKSGKVHSEPCWVVAIANPAEISKYYNNFNKKSKLILMPAFNPLVGSAIKKGEHLGPILNNNLFKLNDALLFNMHGVLIGKLSEVE
ncbi:MAG: metallophosphoesterase [Candidatus Bilamarchaeaceae archaeon]